jgi:hypothetical protein
MITINAEICISPKFVQLCVKIKPVLKRNIINQTDILPNEIKEITLLLAGIPSQNNDWAVFALD